MPRRTKTVAVTCGIIFGISLLSSNDVKAQSRVDIRENRILALPSVDLKVVTHNVCGGMCKRGGNSGIPELISAVNNPSFAPDVFMLQEVCKSQFNTLQNALSSKYFMAYSKMYGGYSSCGATPNDEMGIAVATQRNSLMTPVVTVIPLGGESYQIDQDGNPISARKFNALCLDSKLVALPNRVIRSCSTHLRAFTDAGGVNVRARTAQTATLASELDLAVYQDKKLVILGGDLNSRPADNALNSLYRSETGPQLGVGAFYEADQDTPLAPDSYCKTIPCRSGEYTVGSWNGRNPTTNITSGTAKYDYIFFSETADPASVSGLPIFIPFSDHAYYRGLISVRIS